MIRLLLAPVWAVWVWYTIRELRLAWTARSDGDMTEESKHLMRVVTANLVVVGLNMAVMLMMRLS